MQNYKSTIDWEYLSVNWVLLSALKNDTRDQDRRIEKKDTRVRGESHHERKFTGGKDRRDEIHSVGDNDRYTQNHTRSDDCRVKNNTGDEDRRV